MKLLIFIFFFCILSGCHKTTYIGSSNVALKEKSWKFIFEHSLNSPLIISDYINSKCIKTSLKNKSRLILDSNCIPEENANLFHISLSEIPFDIDSIYFRANNNPDDNLFSGKYFSLKLSNNICITANNKSSIELQACVKKNRNQLFTTVKKPYGGYHQYSIVNVETNRCISSQNKELTLENCAKYKDNQIFAFFENYPSIKFKNKISQFPITSDELKSLMKSDITIGTEKYNIVLLHLDTIPEEIVLKNKELLPNINKLRKESMHFKEAYSPSSSTYHTIFSMFYNHPSFYREYISNLMQFNDGAPTLNLLSTLGYKIEFYAHPEYHACSLNEPNIIPYDIKEFSLLAGNNYQLWDSCSKNSITHKLANENRGQHTIYNFNHGQKDINNLNKFIKYYSIILKERKDPTLSFISWMSSHDPYSWTNEDVKDPKVPNWGGSSYWNELEKNKIDGFNEGSFNKQMRQKFMNSYLNSLKQNDINLGKLLDFLKEKDVYDKTIFVLYSDHGESLWQNDYLRHGGPPSKNRINVMLYIHWPQKLEYLNIKVNQRTSLMDLFPILFEKMDMKSNNPLFDNHFKYKEKKCHISSKPNGEKFLDEITFISEKYKVHLQSEFKKVHRSEKINIPLDSKIFNTILLTDTNDVKINDENLYNIDFFKDNFKHCLIDLFGKDNWDDFYFIP